MNIRLNYLKSETVRSIDMEFSTLNTTQYTSSYDQSSADLIKLPLLKSPGKYSHVSQFTKNISSMTLEGNNLLQIQKCWYAIISAFCQFLSTNKSWPSKKYLRA